MNPEGSYLSRYRKYGVDPKTLKWKSARAAKQRYEEIVSLVNFEGKSILDVGCGFGGIIPFISAKAKKFSYTGIDVVGEFIKEAQRFYPKHTFATGNYFTGPLKEEFDVVIANGSLNSNVKNNLGYRKKAIRTMYQHARETVFFNMAGGHPQKKTAKGSNVWFADSLQILRFCQSLTPDVVFINHPKRREFSVVLLRK